jgi:GTP-binding protein
VAGAYKTIRSELELYDAGLTEKPEIVVLNKVDALLPEEAKAKAKALKKASRSEPMLVSGATHQGLEAVLHAVLRVLDEAKAGRDEAARAATHAAWTP